MSLDPTTRRELLEAREKIIAQLDELEFRVAGNAGGWRQRGPQDSGDIHDALKKELAEIDQLLGPGDQEASSKSAPAGEAHWSTSEPTVQGRLWAALQVALLVTALGFAVAYSLR
jgi:hypothetical protein